MQNISDKIRQWKNLLHNKDFLWQLLLVILLWMAGLTLNKYVMNYLDSLGNLPPVDDLILSHLPILNLGIIYIYGVIFIAFFFIIWLFFNPNKFLYSLKMIAVVFIVRTFFISLTHVGPPAGFMLDQFADMKCIWGVRHMLHSNDIFFSGHVSFPFVCAMIVGVRNQRWFSFFLISSIVMAFTVLSMRVHYSIDVFAAFFIVYALIKLIPGNSLPSRNSSIAPPPVET